MSVRIKEKRVNLSQDIIDVNKLTHDKIGTQHMKTRPASIDGQASMPATHGHSVQGCLTFTQM